jgi:carbonyl reductase 1
MKLRGHSLECISVAVLILTLTQFTCTMAGKICIVTGSNKGIGYEIARKLGSAQYKVIVACRDELLGNQAAERFSTMGYDAVFERLDIADTSSIETFISRINNEYPHVDVLVNNAAMAFKSSDPTPFHLQAQPTLQVNYFGTLQLTQGLLPILKKSDNPIIVNLGSVAGHLKILKSENKKMQFMKPSITLDELNSYVRCFMEDVMTKGVNNEWSNTCYGMSKLAVICMTKILANAEPSIKINAYCPGFCSTDMSSHRGSRSPEQGARVGLYLATLDRASSISGKFFTNDKTASEAVW